MVALVFFFLNVVAVALLAIQSSCRSGASIDDNLLLNMAEETRKEEDGRSKHGDGEIQIAEQAIVVAQGVEAQQIGGAGLEDGWTSSGLSLRLCELNERLSPYDDLHSFARLDGRIALAAALWMSLHQELNALGLNFSPQLNIRFTGVVLHVRKQQVTRSRRDSRCGGRRRSCSLQRNWRRRNVVADLQPTTAAVGSAKGRSENRNVILARRASRFANRGAPWKRVCNLQLLATMARTLQLTQNRNVVLALMASRFGNCVATRKLLAVVVGIACDAAAAANADAVVG